MSPVRLLFGFTFFALPSFGWAAVQTPDLEVQVTRGPVKYPVVNLKAEAPSKHHFNLKAPWSAKTSGTGIVFDKRATGDRVVEFESADPSIQENESVEVTVYLCDDANTYCVKKTQSIALARAKVLPESAFQKTAAPKVAPKAAVTAAASPTPTAIPNVLVSPAPSAPAAVPSSAKKDELGFWNDEESAFNEAKKTGKLVLIDFYGIWCPPCNLYNEVVFPSKTFQAQAKSFVLLKIDADRNESWALKSRYKVGGYPTLIFATPKGDEVDRAVGFFPRDRLASLMKEALQNRELPFTARVQRQRDLYILSLERLIRTEFEKKDVQATAKALNEGLKVDPENVWMKLIDLWVKAKEDIRVLGTKENQAFLAGLESKRSQLRSEELIKHAELVQQFLEVFSNAQKKSAIASLDEIIPKRINPFTLHLDGEEWSIADLRAMKWELLKSLSGEPEMAAKGKETLKEIISDYQNLMKAYRGQQSRGFNLELAYYLGQDGQVAQATQIYDTFMKRYPKEFTYFFAAARHFQENAKDLDRARMCADRALALSYGDNQIRSVTRLLSIRVAQGQGAEGIEQAKAVLAKVPKFDGLSIRTGRYVAALEKAIEKAQSEIKK